MKKFLFTLVGLFFLFSSCAAKDSTENNEEARELFEHSSLLILEIKNKIGMASDSLHVDSLLQIFDKRIVEINFSKHPETDFKLTEEENDSLYKLIKELKLKSEEKYQEFAIQIPDTINLLSNIL